MKRFYSLALSIPLGAALMFAQAGGAPPAQQPSNQPQSGDQKTPSTQPGQSDRSGDTKTEDDQTNNRKSKKKGKNNNDNTRPDQSGDTKGTPPPNK